MAISALTKVQQATMLALAEARRLDAVPVDASRAVSFMRQAEERPGQLPCSPASRLSAANNHTAERQTVLATPVALFGLHVALV